MSRAHREPSAPRTRALAPAALPPRARTGLRGAGLLAAGLLATGLLTGCDDEEAPAGCAPKAGHVCTVVGTGTSGLTDDGLPALETELYLPQDMTLGPDGRLFILDWNNHRVRVLGDGVVSTVVGTGYLGDAPDGKGAEVSLNHPTHVTFTADGDMIISAWHNSKILRYDFATDQVTTICGTGARSFNGDGIEAVATHLDLPSAAVVAADGRIFFSDQANQRVRVIEADGTVVTYAGNGEKAYSGDGGPALEAALNMPVSQSAPPGGRIDMDFDGVLYLADTSNHVVRRVGTDRIITTILGTGTAGNGTGAVGPQVALSTPSDVATDGNGNLYVADTMNHCVRKVAADGTVSTAAGVCGQRGYTGDGGPANAALFDRPYGVHVGADGVLYVADTHNHVVRAVYP